MEQVIREEEIDLRPYLRAILKRWRLVMALILGFGLATSLFALQRSSGYDATAVVLLRFSQSQLALDERFVTEDTELDRLATDSQRKALMQLATSPLVEIELSADQIQRFVPTGYQPGQLAGRIQAETQGDLLLITATGSSAEEARDLAQLWAQTYVSYVNSLYAGQPSTQGPSQELALMEANYEQVQQAYEEYLRTNQAEELNHKITSLTNVLDEALKADQERYRSYQGQIRELELVLRSAEALRRELAGDGSIGLGEALSFLSLRARAAGGSALPVELQLDSLSFEGELTPARVEALIAQLDQQIVELREVADTLALAMVQTTGASMTLQDDQRSAYLEELRSLREQREAEEGRGRMLVQRRDVALETLQVARRKAAEQQMGQGGTEVQASMPNTEQILVQERSLQLVLFALLGVMLGALIGGLTALFLELWRPALRAQATRPPRERPADHPTPS